MGEVTKRQKGIKKINLTPVGNNMITTAYFIKPNDGIIIDLNYRPKFLQVQQVLAVGPRVEDIKVGDWVYIDYERFNRHVKTKSAVKVGIGGQDMIKEEFVPPVFVAPGDDSVYFKISDREHEGVIVDFKKLPKEMREYITVETFEEKIKPLREQAAKDKLKFDKQITKSAKESEESLGPAVVAEGKFRG